MFAILCISGMISAVNAVLLILLWRRKPASPLTELQGHLDHLEKNQERMERLIRDEIAQSRVESGSIAQQSRQETARNLTSFSDSVLSRMADLSLLQKNQLDTFSQQLASLTQMNEQKLENIRSVVEERLRFLLDENNQKLEQMRATVDEKLHETLERRLGESFKFISERLEKVHQGLGEMQNLASGVGDLKRVLANVKTRGIWGEVQLENLLEQILTPEQYERNVVTKKNSRDPVDFVIKFPGGADKQTVFLPIDAKFPMEDYERLQDAQERADIDGIEAAGKALEQRLKLEARHIKEKYLDPPFTTEFAILFVPTEGLYAELLRRAGLCDSLRVDHRIILTGPTTIAALLNSLRMGFRTLAVEQRASDVWTLLGSVKTEFNKFGDILEKTHKKLQEASDTISDAARKSRTIERKLKDVQELPAAIALRTGPELLPENRNAAEDDSILQ